MDVQVVEGKKNDDCAGQQEQKMTVAPEGALPATPVAEPSRGRLKFERQVAAISALKRIRSLDSIRQFYNLYPNDSCACGCPIFVHVLDEGLRCVTCESHPKWSEEIRQAIARIVANIPPAPDPEVG